MNQAQVSGFRKLAGVVSTQGRFTLFNGSHIVAFDLTRERAEDWARYYPNARIVEDRQGRS